MAIWRSKQSWLRSPDLNLPRELLILDAENKMVRTAGLEPAFPFEKQIFVPPRLSPPPHRRLWSGLYLHRGVAALGAARLVSTPSRRRALKLGSSPLRLPFRHARFGSSIPGSGQ